LPTGSETGRRVCLLTGAGGTLGSAFCQAYGAHYDIVAVARHRVPVVPSQDEWFVDPLAPEAELPENDGRVYVVRSDLEQPGQVERVVDLALARHGRVDLLVNAAAYSVSHAPGLVDGDRLIDTVDRHFAVNVGIPLRLATRLAQRFWMGNDLDNRAQNRNIVNVSSLAGSRVYPGGQAVYAASKAALNQLTRHMAAEFAEFGLRANALAPNSFPSIVSTESVVKAIARLDADTVTGKVLVMDGDSPGSAGTAAPAD
jgi:NAD(P)-dependent dehydrogenase (short-subunit alcohol dehydrogenase family)